MRSINFVSSHIPSKLGIALVWLCTRMLSLSKIALTLGQLLSQAYYADNGVLTYLFRFSSIWLSVILLVWPVSTRCASWNHELKFICKWLVILTIGTHRCQCMCLSGPVTLLVVFYVDHSDKSMNTLYGSQIHDALKITYEHPTRLAHENRIHGSLSSTITTLMIDSEVKWIVYLFLYFIIQNWEVLFYIVRASDPKDP